MAAFWADVLGWQVITNGWQRTEHGRDGACVGPRAAVPSRSTSAGCRTPTDAKNRLHFDINPIDRDQAAELERLLALGAMPSHVALPTSLARAGRPGGNASACADRCGRSVHPELLVVVPEAVRDRAEAEKVRREVGDVAVADRLLALKPTRSLPGSR